MKSFPFVAGVLAVLVGAAVAADPVNKLCPVRGDKAGNPTKTASYSKNVSFCSAACKNKFEKSPGSFGRELAAFKEDGKTCLVDGKPAVASFTSEYKCEVTFCCDRCKGRFESAPDKFIEKALKK